MSPTEIDIDDVISRIDYLVLLAVRRCVVRCDDADDLRQDIFIALFNRVQKFDSRLSSWSTFINMIIESEIQHFCLSKRWRKNQTFSSIDDLTESEHPLTNFYPICDLNDQERFFFWHEFDDAIKKLPEAVREICFCLKRYSKHTTASRLNISTCKLSCQIKKIRRLFSKTKILREFIT